MFLDVTFVGHHTFLLFDLCFSVYFHSHTRTRDATAIVSDGIARTSCVCVILSFLRLYHVYILCTTDGCVGSGDLSKIAKCRNGGSTATWRPMAFHEFLIFFRFG
jgi:hypothetical protein